MPGIFALRQIIPTRLTASSNAQNPLNSSLDGALDIRDWKLARIFEGRGYHVSIGAFSTPITGGGAGTIFDQDQPEGVLSIPSGVTLIPVRIHVQTQTPLLATDADESEILIAVDRLAASNASSATGTAETIFNMRTDNPQSSLITATSAVTTNITNPTLDIELASSRLVGDVQGTAATVNLYQFRLDYEPKNPPIILGPAMVVGYWGGSIAATGFAQLNFLAFPSALVSALA